MTLAGADSFAVELGKGEKAVEWMNSYAEKNGQKFEAKLAGYTMQTVKFGDFEMITWAGDWSVARNIIRKASGKLNAKVIESGYHEKRGLLDAMFGGAEFGKVYSGGKISGRIELDKKGGRWMARAEAYV